MFKNKIKLKLALAFMVCVFISYFLSVYFLFVIFSVILTYYLTARIVGFTYFNSKLFIGFVSFFLYISLLQCVILASSVFVKNVSLENISIICFVILFLSNYALSRNKARVKNLQLPALNSSDWMSIAVCCLIVIAVIILPVIKSVPLNSSSFFVFINNSIDDSTHLGLLNDRLQYDTGVLSTINSDYKTRAKSIESYPGSWHAANALIIKSLIPNISTGIESTVAYIISKVFWFAVLIFIFCRSAFALYRRSSKNQTHAGAALVGMMSLLFSFIFLVDPFALGFYSFLPQLIATPLFILGLLQLHSTGRNDYVDILNSLLLLLIVASSAILSWLLLAPVFMLSISLGLYNYVSNTNSSNLKRFLQNKFFVYYFLYALILVSVLAQIYISTTSTGTIGFISSILLAGGMVVYSNIFYLLVLVGVILYVVNLSKYYLKSNLEPILYFVVPLAMFCFLIYGIQMYEVQANRYYFFKSLFVLAFILMLISIVGLAQTIDRFAPQINQKSSILLSLCIPVFFVIFLYPTPAVFGYIKGIRPVSQSVNSQIYKTLNNTYTQQNYLKKDVSIFYPTNSLGLNEVASTLLKSNKPYSECYDQLKSDSVKISISNFDVSSIKHLCAAYNVTYYVDADRVSTIKNILKKEGLSSRVSVFSINN